MDCEACGSNDVDIEYLWPRENLDDLACECCECGNKWELILERKKESQ